MKTMSGTFSGLTVCRYVERNALRAILVERAEQWNGSSLAAYARGGPRQARLSPWPLRRSPDWIKHVNTPQSEAELAAIRRSIRRGRPFGDDDWTVQTASQLNLESTLVPRGRPRLAPEA